MLEIYGAWHLYFNNIRNCCVIFDPQARQGIIHQGQGMSFTTQMGPPQLPPQLSSMGITMSPQYPPQQGGKFGQRKTTVKITHPDTHEELRLDKRADSYSDGVADLPNLEHSRDVNTIISSAPSTTIPVTVKPSAGSIGEKVAGSMQPNSSHGVEKSESPKHVGPSGEASSTHPQRDSEICSESSLQQSKHGTESLVSKLLPVVTKQSAVSAVVSSEALLSNPLSSASVSPSEESTVVVPNNEGRRRDILGRSNSVKDHQKKRGKKRHIQSQHQVLLWCITLSFNHFSILFSPFSLIFMQKFTLFYWLALNLLQPQICILRL
jgi:translation initiation factor 4G